MRPSCKTEVILYLFLAFGRNLAAHNLTILRSAGTSNKLVLSQNSLNSSDDKSFRTLSSNPTLPSLSSSNGPWSSKRSFHSVTSRRNPSGSLWQPDGVSAGVLSTDTSLSEPGGTSASAFPSFTASLGGVLGISGSSLQNLRSRRTNSTYPPTITAPPTPVSYIDGAPVFAANASLPPGYSSGVLSLAYFGQNCSMGGPPYGYNAKSCSCVNSNLKWQYDHATATITTQDCQSTLSHGHQRSASCSYDTVTELAAPYVAPTDCCNRCDIRASAVQLIYWPPEPSNAAFPSVTNQAAFFENSSAYNITAAHIPPEAASSGLVSDGFTFISPSVYVAYTGISAVASCIALGTSQITLNNIYTVTRAYPPESLSSAKCMGPDSENMWLLVPLSVGPGRYEPIRGIFNGWEQVNYSELANPPPPASKLLSRYQSCFTTRSIDSSLASYLFMTPQLSIPSDVTDIDEQWQGWGAGTCTPVALGVLDPPRVLGRATGLGPPLVTSTSSLEGQYPPAAPAKTTPFPAIKTPSPSAASPESDPKFLANGPAETSSAAQNPGANYPFTVNPARPEEAGVTAPLPNYSRSQPTTASDSNAGSGLPLNSGGLPSESSNTPMQNGVGAWSDPNAPASGGLSPPLDNNNNNINNKPGAAAESGSTQTYPHNGADTAGGDQLNRPITLSPIEPSRNTQSADGNTPAHSAAQPLPLISGQPILRKANNDLIVAGNTVPAGSQAVIADHTISNGANNVMVDSSTYTLQPPSLITSVPALPSVEGHQVFQIPNGDVVVAGSTIAPGNQVNVAGHTISNDASNMVIDSSTYALQPPSLITSVPALPSVEGHQVFQIPNGDVVVAGSTIAPGNQVNVAGHTISNGASNMVIDSSTYALQPPSLITSVPALPSVEGHQVFQIPNGDVVVAGSTIAPGHQVNVAGHTISNGASNMVIDSSTYALQPPSLITSVPALPSVEGHQVFQIPNGDVVVAGSTIAPGHQVNVAGHTFSNAADHIVLDGNSQAITPLPGPSPLLSDNQIVRVSNRHLQVGGQTLALGSQMAVSGHRINYANPSQAIVDGISFALLPLPTSNPLVIADQTIHRAPDGGLIIGSLTMAPGAQATVSGHVYSMDGSSSVVVDGSMTYSLPPTENAYIVQDMASTTPPNGSIGPMTSKRDQYVASTALVGSDSSHIGSAASVTAEPVTTNGIGGAIVAVFGKPNSSDQRPEGPQIAAATRNDIWDFALAGALGVGVWALIYVL
ncbi:hypothetical protein N7G274_010491 [Stereocaulon virgatum]|uniref:Uncharacterized protein n=1 Tax=Stereocaulon virgatum TaxID=373712 RepID=A0ABR3ZXH8_9LECA